MKLKTSARVPERIGRPRKRGRHYIKGDAQAVRFLILELGCVNKRTLGICYQGTASAGHLVEKAVPA
jgi:hypothetical protein